MCMNLLRTDTHCRHSLKEYEKIDRYNVEGYNEIKMTDACIMYVYIALLAQSVAHFIPSHLTIRRRRIIVTDSVFGVIPIHPCHK